MMKHACVSALQLMERPRLLEKFVLALNLTKPNTNEQLAMNRLSRLSRALPVPEMPRSHESPGSDEGRAGGMEDHANRTRAVKASTVSFNQQIENLIHKRAVL